MDTASLRARCAQMKRLASFLNDLSQMDVPWKQSTLIAHLHDVYASSENSILLAKRLKKTFGGFLYSVLNLLYRQEVWPFPLVYCVAHGEETILSYHCVTCPDGCLFQEFIQHTYVYYGQLQARSQNNLHNRAVNSCFYCQPADSRSGCRKKTGERTVFSFPRTRVPDPGH
jgi:hypothetical protein